MLILLFASLVLEAIIYIVPKLWALRKTTIAVPMMLTSFASVGVLMLHFNWFAWLIMSVSVFRIINHLRIAKGRMHQIYLYKTARRTGLIFCGLQMVLLMILIFGSDILLGVNWWIFAALQVVVSIVVLSVTTNNFSKTRFTEPSENYADKDLPTLTIAIPARNETQELEDCLISVLASDYPKLEVLVLDDCSSDRTAEVIRSFAHDGVRFIKGAELSDNWIAKNQAYDRLADEASGQFILFCGVDVRFQPKTFRKLITKALYKEKDMFCVMPMRANLGLFDDFVQPLRYWWELALPRKIFNRPPALSTCWVIKRNTLQKLGAFDAVSHSVLPEHYFAKQIIKNNRYSFLRSNPGLGVVTQKTASQQRTTAIRLRYPQIHRRPELALLLLLFETLFLLAPFAIAVSTVFLGFGLVQILATIASVLLIITHVMIIAPHSIAEAASIGISFPFAVITELIIGMISMYKYEFTIVDWKGRNICLPVMHTIPKKDFVTQINNMPSAKD